MPRDHTRQTLPITNFGKIRKQREEKNMKTNTMRNARGPWLYVGCCVATSLASIVHAENNTNYVFDGTPGAFATLNIPMTSPGTNDSLQVLNGGSVTVSGNSFIGHNAGDNNNYALVTGTNLSGVSSIWSTAGDVYIGFASGANSNSLTVSNGG